MADNQGLTSLQFVERGALVVDNVCGNSSVIRDTKRWLDIYFSGREPDFKLPLHFTGTEFQNEVWRILCTIPYGETMSYGEIASIMARRRGLKKMSAQAVGGAVGKNKIPIIIPCHRVVGANGNLTGYTGGLSKKIKLLKLENGYRDDFFMPKKNTPEGV